MRSLLYLALSLSLLTLTACDTVDSSEEAVRADGLVTANAHVPGEEEIGNNLSFPVIWSDMVPLALRGTYKYPQLDGRSFDADGEQWYVQHDPLSEWQAESAFPVDPRGSRWGRRGFVVSAVDWGDNLEARDWTYGRPVRVEVALYKVLDAPMWGYTMKAEDPTAHGQNEVWGTNGVMYPTDTSLVYSAAAQLVIQKLDKSRDDPSLAMQWTGDRWTGDVGDPVFSQGIWDAVESGFKTEVNVQGRVIYGFNWRPAQGGQGEGDYRITFVLQRESPVRLNTFFDGQTTVVVSDEHLTLPAVEIAPGEGGVPSVLWTKNLTYIDVRLTHGG